MIYFLICLGASIIGAISGMGGGVIIKPVLDTMGTMDVTTISFLSGCTVLSMSMVTLYRNRHSEIKVDKIKGTYLAIGAAFGGIVGKRLFDLIKHLSDTPHLVGAAQSFILAIITLGVLFFTLNRAHIKPYIIQGKSMTVIIGLVLGVLSAFLGIGGGPINLAVLFYFFAMDSKTAALNSIYIIFFSQTTSLIQTILRGSVPNFQWSIFLMMVAGGIAGGIVGPIFSNKMSTKHVDRLFLIVVILVTGISLINGINYLT